MEERLRFFAYLLDGETMTDVCRELGISRTRKTGYKIFNRYKDEELDALAWPTARGGRCATRTSCPPSWDG